MPVVIVLPAGGAAPSGVVFTFRGADTTNVSSVVFNSTTIDIGSATADRFVIIALSDQNGDSVISITCNGVLLAQDVQNTVSRGVFIWSGLVGTAGGAGPATIVATFGSLAGFTDRNMIVWTGTGMANTAGAATTANGSASTLAINVTAGDLLITSVASVLTYSGSTQAVTAVRTEGHPSPVYTMSSGEWNKIVSTNAAFSIATGTGAAAATYH